MSEFIKNVRMAWAGMKPQDQVCTVLMIPLGIVGVAFIAHGILADRGCAAHVGVWTYATDGLAALILGIVLGTYAAFLVRIVIGVPEIAMAAKKKVYKIRDEREWRRTHYPNDRSFDWGPILRTTLLFLVVAATVIMIGGGIGYITWLLFC